MNIVEKLKNDEFTNDELVGYLENPNPIVLYATISCIVRNGIIEEKIIEKLLTLTKMLGEEHKMLGYYKLGHIAMGALLKLGIDEKLIFRNDLDSFEKEIAIKFSQSAW